MKYQIPQRAPYTLRDRNKPKVNPFPSFDKIAEKIRGKAKKQKLLSYCKEALGDQVEDSSTSTSTEDNQVEQKVALVEGEFEGLGWKFQEREIVALEIEEVWEEGRGEGNLFEEMIKETQKGFDFLFY